MLKLQAGLLPCTLMLHDGGCKICYHSQNGHLFYYLAKVVAPNEQHLVQHWMDVFDF